jgi:hypothetical protein
LQEPQHLYISLESFVVVGPLDHFEGFTDSLVPVQGVCVNVVNEFSSYLWWYLNFLCVGVCCCVSITIVDVVRYFLVDMGDMFLSPFPDFVLTSGFGKSLEK